MASSPAVDAGVLAATSGSTDLAGGPRAQGGSVDMGAFEAEPPPPRPRRRSPAPSPTPAIFRGFRSATGGAIPRSIAATGACTRRRADHDRDAIVRARDRPTRRRGSSWNSTDGARLLADVGVDEEVGEAGSVVFEVGGRRATNDERPRERIPGPRPDGRRRREGVLGDPCRHHRRRRPGQRSRGLGRRPLRLRGLNPARTAVVIANEDVDQRRPSPLTSTFEPWTPTVGRDHEAQTPFHRSGRARRRQGKAAEVGDTQGAASDLRTSRAVACAAGRARRETHQGGRRRGSRCRRRARRGRELEAHPEAGLRRAVEATRYRARRAGSRAPSAASTTCS